MKHSEFQNNVTTAELVDAIEKIMMGMGNNRLTMTTPRATELLFGCPMQNIPLDNNDLWKLYNHLWDGSNPGLIVTIAKNHRWADQKPANEIYHSKADLSFEIYPGEFIIITGDGAAKTRSFINQIITVGGE